MKVTTISERLKQAMSYRNLKQADVLDRCKRHCIEYGVQINSSDLSQYVTGKIVPRQNKLAVLALALNVNEVWLMGYDAPMIIDESDQQSYPTPLSDRQSSVMQRIKERRLELNLTLEEVAKLVGVSKPTVLRWENGDIESMRSDKIEKLANALMTTPAYIMGWIDNPNQSEQTLQSEGQRIRNLRRKAGFTQIELSNMLSTSQANLSSWELDKWQPDQEILNKLSQIFGVTIDYILYGDKEHSNINGNTTPAEPQIVDEVILNDMYTIPLLGSVVAGVPIEAQENLEGYIYISHRPPEEYFALRVHGDSMKNIGITDGCIIVCHKQPVAENGEIIVAMLNGEQTVKRYRSNDKQVFLQPENQEYLPIVISPDDELLILGKVVEIRVVL